MKNFYRPNTTKELYFAHEKECKLLHSTADFRKDSSVCASKKNFPKPTWEGWLGFTIPILGGMSVEFRDRRSTRLKRMADALGVSADYLIEGTMEEAAKARFEDRELLFQFQEVEKLADEDKTVVKKLIEAFLTKKQLQSLAAR